MSPHGRIAWLAWALSLAGCTLGEGGVDPEPGTLNFPIAIALSPAAEGEAPAHLYVVNSNFDLSFNEGTLMAFDLEELSGRIGDDCTADDPCEIEDLDAPLLEDEIGIGSHADGLAVSPDGGRLYIASRSRTNLTFVNWIEDGAFDCETMDVQDDVRSCVDQGTVVAEGRELDLEDWDPVAVTAGRLADVGGADADFVLLGLRDGRVALFIDRPDAAPDEAPVLVDIATGFPGIVNTVTLQPGTGLAWLTSRDSANLGRVGIAADPVDPLGSFVYDAGSVRLGGLDTGDDTLDLQFDPDGASARAFVLTRGPDAVAELDLSRMGLNAGDAAIDDVFEVGRGPSRLAIGRVGGQPYALATTFDGRKLFVIDVEHGALVAVVGGFSGPFELVIDPARELAYVVDFTVSVVRVVDLAPLRNAQPPFIAATVGKPTPVEDLTN